MIPTATAEIVRRGPGVVREYFQRYTTRSVAIAFPISVLAAVAAPALFVAWLGTVPSDTLTVMFVLTAANFVNVASGVAMTLSLAGGEPGLVASNAMLVAAVNLALTAALAPVLGLWGVLAGTFGAITGGTLIFIARFQRRWGVPAPAFAAAVRTPAALALGLAVPIALAELVLDDRPPTRATAAAATLGIVAAYLIPYWLLASRLGILPAPLRLGALRARLRRRNANGPAPPPRDAGPDVTVRAAVISGSSTTASTRPSSHPPQSR
jgi:hypothetical protein